MIPLFVLLGISVGALFSEVLHQNEPRKVCEYFFKERADQLICLEDQPWKKK